jgi:hypothetical protein
MKRQLKSLAWKTILRRRVLALLLSALLLIPAMPRQASAFGYSYYLTPTADAGVNSDYPAVAYGSAPELQASVSASTTQDF